MFERDRYSTPASPPPPPSPPHEARRSFHHFHRIVHGSPLAPVFCALNDARTRRALRADTPPPTEHDNVPTLMFRRASVYLHARAIGATNHLNPISKGSA